MNKQEIIYYSDELNDEFSGAEITPRKIDENYKYIHKNIPSIVFCNFMNFKLSFINSNYNDELFKYNGSTKRYNMYVKKCKY